LTFAFTVFDSDTQKVLQGKKAMVYMAHCFFFENT